MLEIVLQSMAAGVAAIEINAARCAAVTIPAATHAPSIPILPCPAADALKSSTPAGHDNKSSIAKAALRIGEVASTAMSAILPRSPVAAHQAASAVTGTPLCTVRPDDKLCASAASARLLIKPVSADVSGRPTRASIVCCGVIRSPHRTYLETGAKAGRETAWRPRGLGPSRRPQCIASDRLISIPCA